MDRDGISSNKIQCHQAFIYKHNKCGADRQTDRHTDGQTDRQTDRQTDSAPWENLCLRFEDVSYPALLDNCPTVNRSVFWKPLDSFFSVNLYNKCCLSFVETNP